MADALTLVAVSNPELTVSAKKNAVTILQLQSGIAWRQYLKRASFRGEQFYVDTGVRESGRRVVNHEFPKRNLPYAEDMGRRAREFTVRGYLIVYPNNVASGGQDYFPNDPLKKANYITARDALITALETDDIANLQLPLLGVMSVMCTRYRVTEEEKLGGYCVFDMTFTEFGQAPANGERVGPAGVFYAADALSVATQQVIINGISNINIGSIT
jgi:prophage DNA circulation protein